MSQEEKGGSRGRTVLLEYLSRPDICLWGPTYSPTLVYAPKPETFDFEDN